MRKPSFLPGLIFVVIVGVGLAFAYSIFSVSNYGESLAIVVVSAIIAFIVSYSV
jgi:hypothetical protein